MQCGTADQNVLKGAASIQGHLLSAGLGANGWRCRAALVSEPGLASHSVPVGGRTVREGVVRCCYVLGVRESGREERKLWMGPPREERRGEGPGARERSDSI